MDRPGIGPGDEGRLEDEFPPPELEDWDGATPPRSGRSVAAWGAFATLVLAASAFVVASVVADDDPADSDPPLRRSVEDYNPTGFDGTGADVALRGVAVAANGHGLTLAFDGPLAEPTDVDLADGPDIGGCAPVTGGLAGEAFLNIRLVGAVDVRGLNELVEETGAVVTGRSPVGSVRSVTITCHREDATVVAVGLAGERLYSVRESADADVIRIELSADS